MGCDSSDNLSSDSLWCYFGLVGLSGVTDPKKGSLLVLAEGAE